ncbi:MAG TPA: gamma-glutamyltransferase family protein [Alphaproteobacteria bacterium]|nr:gamma-glutamyltransferase family protein [Alphaproteobacteria bacterium]
MTSPLFTTRPELAGTFGAVASTHWLASAAGMAILEQGGNAFDAAVAAALVLQVAEPHLNGPGGDVPILLYNAAEERVRVLCGQGPAPAGATIAHYRGEGLDLIPGTGLLATVIPGAFDAWMTMLRDFGTLGLEDIFARALGYADQGVPLVPGISDTIASVRDLFSSEWTTSAAVFLPGGEVPAPGTVFANKALAATWRRILDEAKGPSGREAQIDKARESWSQGFVAEAIDRFCRDNEVLDASGARHRGVLSGTDMAGWEAGYEDPLSYDYCGHTVFKSGPWAQAPVFLQQLALLKGFDVAAMDPTGPDFVHTVVECAKLAFSDREAWYGDPAFVDVPLGDLLSDAYNDERRALVTGAASLDLRPGSPGGRAPRLPDLARGPSAADAGVGDPTTASPGGVRGDTCHLDVVDRWGNMVSATPSGGWLQSSPVVPELGFSLNTRAQMFWLEEGLPSSLEPGKRPRTTLTPTLVFRGGSPYVAMGTPGGDQQDQWQVTCLLHHIDHGMNLQEMIDTPSFHSGHCPSSFFPRAAQPGHLVVESRFGADTVAELERRGHGVETGPAWSEGRMSAVSRDKGLVRAAANPRGMQGYAVCR